MNKRFFILFVFLSTALHAQQKLTLEQCLDKALLYNHDLVIGNNNVLDAEINSASSKTAILPILGANWNYNTTFGTTFDNVTFQRIQKTTNTSFPSLNLSLNLFSGFSQAYRIKYTKYAAAAAHYRYDQQKNEILLQLTNVYYQIIVDEHYIKICGSRVKALQSLFRLAEIEHESGARKTGSLAAVKSQLETEKSNLLDAENKKVNDLLTLSQLIGEESGTTIEVVPELSLKNEGIANIDSLFLIATASNPQQLYYHFNTLAVKQQQKLAWSSFSPKLYFNASIASSYSSNGIYDFNTNQVIFPSYSDQLQMNSYQFIGLTLQVPLFNGMSTWYDTKKKAIYYENAILQESKYKQELRINLQQVVNEMEVTLLKKSALALALESANDALRETEIKYKEGNASFYDYLNALNFFNQAELNEFENGLKNSLAQKKLQFLLGK